MTKGDLIAAVSHEADLDSTVGSDDRADMERWLLQAIQEILERTHCHLEVADITFPASTPDLRLDAIIVAVHGRTVPTDRGELLVIPIQEMLNRRRRPTSLDAPAYIAAEGDLWMIDPAPTADMVARVILVPMPAAMTDDTQSPDSPTYGGIPVLHHHAIEEYMLYRAARSNDKKTPMTAQDYFQMFGQSCQRIRRAARKEPGRHLMAPLVGYPVNGQNRVSPRNDAYPTVYR
jgi:hypothetical protein